MSARETLSVVVPLALVRNQQGGFDYLYQGAIVPEGTSADEVKRLKEGGYVEATLVAETAAAEGEPEAANRSEGPKSRTQR